MRLIILACISLALFFTPAFGASVPAYPVEAYCGRIAEVGGDTAQQACMEQEYMGKGRLPSIRTTVETENYCQEVARRVGGSYDVLAACLEEQNGLLQRRY